MAVQQRLCHRRDARLADVYFPVMYCASALTQKLQINFLCRVKYDITFKYAAPASRYGKTRSYSSSAQNRNPIKDDTKGYINHNTEQ